MHSPAPINRFGLAALLIAAGCLGVALGVLVATWPRASFDQCSLVVGLTLFGCGLIAVRLIQCSFQGSAVRTSR